MLDFLFVDLCFVIFNLKTNSNIHFKIESIKLVTRWCIGLKAECSGIVSTLKVLVKILRENMNDSSSSPTTHDTHETNTTSTTTAGNTTSDGDKTNQPAPIPIT